MFLEEVARTFKPKEPAFGVAVFGGVCVGEVVLEARQGLVFALGGDEGEKVWGNLGGSVIELDLAVTWIFFGIDTREKGDVHKQQKRDQGQKESDGFDVAHLGPPAGVCGEKGTCVRLRYPTRKARYGCACCQNDGVFLWFVAKKDQRRGVRGRWLG